MKENNEEKNIININGFILENSATNEKDKEKFLDEKLYKILNENKILNPKKTKFVSKDNYDIIIQILNNLEITSFINFLNYFNKINIQIIKILLNGFIEFEFDDEQTKIILDIFSKIIGIYFNKMIFYLIYKKLSKQYRLQAKIKNIDSIKKIKKILEIWKLLYDSEKLSSFKNIKEVSSITLLPKRNQKMDNINIIFTNEFKNDTDNYQFKIYINFAKSPLLNLNKYNQDFYFLKVINNNNNEEYIFKYDTIFNNNNSYSFSEVDIISIVLQKSTYSVLINNDQKLSEVKVNFNFESISEMKFLNFFYGQIIYIVVIKENLSNKKQTEIEIKNYNSNKIEGHINREKDNKKEIEEVKYNGIIFEDNYFDNLKKRIIKKNKKELNEIEYFGGFECFIPLFKIIKYIISNFNEKDFIKEEIKDNNEYIKKILKWAKDIIKIMIKLICLSENNYINFKKIIAPLIGSLAEIPQSLNTLIKNQIIEESVKTIFFQDEVIYILFIIIINLQVPFNIINAYQKIFEIKNDWDMNKFSFDSIIINIDKYNDINISLDWYFSLLFNFIIFGLLYFDSNEKVKILIDIYDKLIQYISKNIKKNDKSNLLKEVISIKSLINKFYDDKININNNTFNDIFIENNLYFKNIINLIKIYMNVEMFEKQNEINHKENVFIKKININVTNLLDNNNNLINNSNIIKNNKIIEEIKKSFKYYNDQFDFLYKIFPFLKNEDFEPKNKLLLDELIDYNKLYHHLMKELFVFNRLWSKQKLFYFNTLDDRKQSKLKYKNINYYTRNFQRPIIYPVLDYKKRYPNFSKFKKGILFYCIEEDKDDYNFDLDCPKLEEIINEYNKKIFNQIEKESDIHIFKICLIKQQYHVRGNLFVIKANEIPIIYFYSFPYDFKNKTVILLTCNKTKKKNENDLCYGSIFKCSNKEKNRKITININDIRLILKRIYYYRKSAIEIFTETKSYYFNFNSEEELNNFLSIFDSYLNDSKYFPININNNNLGYIKIKRFGISNEVLNKLKNNFIEFISYISKDKIYNICLFDIIILINLISNRSYIDLNQYPVFPLLFFYEKSKQKKRDLREHIGFQIVTEESKKRIETLKGSYFMNLNDKNNEDSDIDDYFNSGCCYFNTHYSNIVYTSNYMVRLFPYSFLVIELQGQGFDDPNRLFFSIEETFYNISAQKSDLRELIPEFFYLPEMFININYIYFYNKTNGELVNEVKMPKDLSNRIYKDFNDNIFDEFDKEGFNVIVNANQNKNEFLKIFIFVDYMKKQLENLNGNLCSWLSLIFGEKQKYKINGKKKEQFFRNESYINNIDEKIFKNYTNNDLVMQAIEFGLIPLQTIFDSKILSNLGYKKNKTEKSGKIHKGFKKIKSYIKNKSNKTQGEKESNINLIDNKSSIDLKIDNDNKLGKLEVFIDNILITEIIDHNDKIIDKFFNERLNMFATTSYDGFAFIYILPNKLFSIIKHPKNLYFDKIFLSSNPFPSIITFEKQNNILTSYSLSGLLIKEKKINKSNIEIIPFFNIDGGIIIDRIKVFNNTNEYNKIYNLPFFDEYIFGDIK